MYESTVDSDSKPILSRSVKNNGDTILFEVKSNNTAERDNFSNEQILDHIDKSIAYVKNNVDAIYAHPLDSWPSDGLSIRNWHELDHVIQDTSNWWFFAKTRDEVVD